MTNRIFSITVATLAAIFLANQPSAALAQLGGVTDAVGDAAGAATDAAGEATDAVGDAAGEATDAAGEAVQDTADAATDVADEAADTATDAADAATDAAQDAADTATDAAEDAAGAAVNTAEDATDTAADAEAGAAVNLGADIGASADGAGLSISSVAENSLAARAGLRAKDKIVSVNGRRFGSQAALNSYLRQQADGRVTFLVQRNGQRHWLKVLLGSSSQQSGALGVTLRDTRSGVAVSQIYKGSPAFEAGLRPGDRIVSLNGQRYRSRDAIVRAIGQMQAGENLSIGVLRNGQRQTIDATLAARGEVLASDFLNLGQQRRTVARPDIDTQSRIEELERQVETLRRDFDGVRSDLETSGTLKARGSSSASGDLGGGADASANIDANTGANADVKAGADADEDADVAPEADVDAGADVGVDAGGNTKAKATGSAKAKGNVPAPSIP